MSSALAIRYFQAESDMFVVVKACSHLASRVSDWCCCQACYSERLTRSRCGTGSVSTITSSWSSSSPRTSSQSAALPKALFRTKWNRETLQSTGDRDHGEQYSSIVNLGAWTLSFFRWNKCLSGRLMGLMMFYDVLWCLPIPILKIDV